MEYRQNKTGEPISILGYGCMRFTTKGGGIDIDKAEKEIMAAYNAGVNYFAKVMGRNIGGHTNGNTCGTVHKQVRKSCWQHKWFF